MTQRFAFLFWGVCLAGIVSAGDFSDAMDSFVKDSCLDCHDSSTETRLDFTSVGYDLSDDKTFRKWVHIFDRIDRGEMPPAGETQLDAKSRDAALQLLERKLKHVNQLSQQTKGRVPTRRLSRQEYEHTLHDLLGIGGDLARYLPPENESGAFDVVAAKQDMSSVHVRSLLIAADVALDEAIQRGPKPQMNARELNYFDSSYIEMWLDRPLRNGGGTLFRTDKDVVTFRGENYVFRSDHNRFKFPVAGQYRITVKAAAHQPRSSITVSLKRQNDVQGDSELFAAWDLVGENYREVSTTKYLRPDDYIYVSADELEPALNGKVIYNSQPASEYGGEGVKIRRVTIEGPLETTWPPQRTRDLFPGIEWKAQRTRQGYQYYDPVLSKPPLDHVRDIVSALAPRAFRRDVSDQEVEALVSLVKPSLESGRSFIDSVRIPIRSILVSPELLFLKPSVDAKTLKLDDESQASRLSFFLWRSLPDRELSKVADSGGLSDSKALTTQVDRMLDDPKSQRFVNEFLGQWLGLDRIDATTPDVYLYPEYDDVLRRAMLAETREFFSHLIKENLSVSHLIDSDFTFLNRKLAEHYGIDGIEGEAMRKVKLPLGSVRGGVLSHASIAKITANGTVTTPVKRGNFVLTNLLGQPPNPPPPGVGAIEPDTRGATTIRETLQKHQSVEACAVCHRRIDPPGFAMECFDPIGTFRDRYRNSKGVKREISAGLRFLHKDYELGQPVDSAGVTADGLEFADIRDFKKHLMKSKDQVARNFLTKLIEFSTGGEIEFADRDEVDRILKETKPKDYPVRALIHQVIASRMFTNR